MDMVLDYVNHLVDLEAALWQHVATVMEAIRVRKLKVAVPESSLLTLHSFVSANQNPASTTRHLVYLTSQDFFIHSSLSSSSKSSSVSSAASSLSSSSNSSLATAASTTSSSTPTATPTPPPAASFPSSPDIMSQISSRYSYLNQRRNSSSSSHHQGGGHDATHCSFHNNSNSNTNIMNHQQHHYRNPILVFSHFLGSPIQGINSEFDISLNLQQDHDTMANVCMTSSPSQVVCSSVEMGDLAAAAASASSVSASDVASLATLESCTCKAAASAAVAPQNNALLTPTLSSSSTTTETKTPTQTQTLTTPTTATATPETTSTPTETPTPTTTTTTKPKGFFSTGSGQLGAWLSLSKSSKMEVSLTDLNTVVPNSF